MRNCFSVMIFILIFSCSNQKSEDIYGDTDVDRLDNKTDDFIPVESDKGVSDNDDINIDDDQEDADIVDKTEESEIPDWEPDICTPNPCIMENSNGICTPFGDTFECGCVESYYWVKTLCVPDSCLDNPCDTVENSNGECLIDGKSYSCECIDNFYWENDSCKRVPEIIFVKAGATGNNDGSSWENAFSDLTDALESVGEPTEKQWIWVAKGTYYPKKGMNVHECVGGKRCNNFALKNNVAIYCGFSGVESTIEERDFVKNEAVFSGDLDKNGVLSDSDCYHVFFNYNNDSTAILDGCIIEGGNASLGGSDESHMRFGGGMNNYNEVKAVIRNTVFRNNYGFIGGGMANMNNSAPTIENCTFENNSSVRGGGIGNSMSSPKIISSKFKNNFTVFENTGFGGAIFNNEGSSPKIENSVFESNTSIDGGAIVNLDASHPSIIGSTFKNNIASRAGGAISNGYQSDPDIINCLFQSNTSGIGGGAIEVYQESYPKIVNSKFLFNKVLEKGFYFGGGILLSGSSIDIINSLFAGNSANSGGGIASQWSIVNLVNNTIVFNTASGDYSYGGGIYNTGIDGEAYITNTIIYDNYSDTSDNDISNDFTLTEVSYSNIKGCLHGGQWDNDCGEDKEWNIDFAPMFSNTNLGDFSLSEESPCIDRGSNDPFETDGIAENVVKDLLGNDRIINGKIDMGAYETEE